MNSKKVNGMFLITILTEFVIVFLLGLFYNYISIGIVSNLILSEMILVVPALLFVLATHSHLRELLVFKPIKISTVFMIILFTYLTMPLVTTINAFTMLFSDNVVAEMSADILSMPFLVMLFLMGIFGPVCEELVFRGIVHTGYRRSGNAIQAMFFSAFLFGLMHMNFNQTIYAFVIGFLLVLLKEVTGSMWGSVVYHVIFNSNTVIMLYVSEKWMPSLAEASAESLATEDLIMTISASMIVATITTAIAACILVWIAKNENRSGILTHIWKERKTGKGRMITVSLVISVILCLAFMIMQLFM
ncbi:MAG: type II CAAX endopeptidase family protein [Lachnospiraceae bacterium]|nr:type II CAAX endopeptidase family protein [Lachnospiraceae bacterium]